jgi:hypothetical protein
MSHAPNLTRPVGTREPITLPNGRQAPVRGITRRSLMIQVRIRETEDHEERARLVFDLMRCYVPSITDEELDDLAVEEMDAIAGYVQGDLDRALEALQKNADAGRAVPQPTAAPRRSRRSTRTTSSTTPSPASGR